VDAQPIDLAVGAIITIRPLRGEDLPDALALVMKVEQDFVSSVWVCTDLEAATERDIVLAPEVTGLPYVVVVMTMAEVLVSTKRVMRRLGLVGESVLDEVVMCRYGEPTSSFEHGMFLKPFGLDAREADLTARIRAYIDVYGENSDESVHVEKSDDAFTKIKNLISIDRKNLTPEQLISLLDDLQGVLNESVDDSIFKILSVQREVDLLS
jgi:hypothetical protein